MAYLDIKYCISCIAIISMCFQSCKEPVRDPKRFKLLPASYTNVDFSNDITENDSINYFKYPYMYMGGGVAIADFNNDGQQDLFFTGNMVSNRLYQNKGAMQFEDKTESGGVSGKANKWYTGVATVDINNDGYMDLYLSVSGMGGNRNNELYINNGNMTFTESAVNFGLADSGNSVQSGFFDYDHDSDLDCYVANYPITSFSTSSAEYSYLVNNPQGQTSDHLFQNNGNGTFVDVTDRSGLLSFGLSLSATIADFNQDGWEDIYVSNDFSTPDFFYINNGDGTFREELKNITKQTAFYGMGADAADINNDGLIDLIQVDMSAEDNRRSKANMASMNPALFWATVNNGFHYQYMFNCLQLNKGIVDGMPVMRNIAFLSGVASTDWSWAPLLADFDNDGFKDLFVANGTRKEINNRDYFKDMEKRLEGASDQELKRLSDNIPSEPIDNYMFKNEGGAVFRKVNQDWGVSYEGFSNGASYGDLDNDGDLDLVVNNIDSKALVYRNNSTDIPNGNYLRVNLKGINSNREGIGAEVQIYVGGELQISQRATARGFQSSVEPYLHFGLAGHTIVDSLYLLSEGKVCKKMYNINVNQTIKVNLESPGIETKNKMEVKHTLFLNATTQVFKDTYYHKENRFNDFAHQVLLPHKMSNFGPALATGDINNDGKEDFYIGGAVGINGVCYLQLANGEMVASKVIADNRTGFEDIDALFFDADNDGDQDLYVVSGGNEYDAGDPNYQDRLYLNKGGYFEEQSGVLPLLNASGSCVKACDYDNDGDLDLFVGGRLAPYNYPFPGTSVILENKLEGGRLKFEDVTREIAPEISDIGMVTDALWTDFDANGQMDLMLVGEWMPIKVFLRRGAKFVDRSDDFFDGNTSGWWFSIDQGDFDNDGDKDYVLGNLGLNYKYQADQNAPFSIYADDFDNNRKNDIVLSYYNFGKEYPVRGRQCSSEQIPGIQIVYKDYSSFAKASVEEIFGSENLKKSFHRKVESFRSVHIENDGGVFKIHPLPIEAQKFAINDILVSDIDRDGNLDLILAGGLYASEVETPRNDAGIGLALMGDGKNNFAPLSLKQSGINIPYDTKKIKTLNIGQFRGFLAANNQGPLNFFRQY